MKKLLMVVGLLTCFSLGGVVIAAATSGTPEIDRANATLGFQGQLRAISCTGEDGITYLTYHGAWIGSASQVLPDATDYGLSGAAKISGIAWTINKTTGRGVLKGTISLTSSAGTLTYSGTLILVTQGLPAPGAAVPGRGWINAQFSGPDDGVPPPGNDDSLIANVEFSLATVGSTGQFGDLAGGGTLGFPDWSVVTNVAPKAADGVC
jgi:hypothetical protein